MFNPEYERLAHDVRTWAAQHGGDRSGLLPVLQEVLKKYNRISDYAMQLIANELDIHPVEVYGVVSFYSFLHKSYHSKFVIRLCRTISCDMAGKDRVARQLENDLGITFGETTPDGKFTLEWANCLGMCDQGPALLVNDRVYTRVTPEMVHDIVESCRKTFSVYAVTPEEVHA
ncbi:MAG TPA: NAD(P)H-dependent oxidoreductase subunit E [Candidatus Hydrogenedentes bacterium]|nr:NAD(P)H-dependent oxidoreductase subunit E [Candidatus Hydrogenedentota bacterium]HOV73521.1 NAD(P)H-dependent oxidoreductase subunit E [Candidatus Hydrogenedentota bacterium]HPC16580.1 NAD(P)H-dependent oxidoreductase subunit E [Candidatus Hydrogenedentota bacterium]HRT18921.1 NAD(P)H-dependent oxidoreductase subunit E [Candidatus Hydrogenedentota bacterium]HRT64967.1 NAD(P)H-dependent oxidoreductase subunit E [Candidatus Hydrogenedentota bacterium]